MPGEVVERHRLPELALSRRDDGERADAHRAVRDQVIEEPSRAEGVVRRDAISMNPACEIDE
jgi:hypothetical protein